MQSLLSASKSTNRYRHHSFLERDSESAFFIRRAGFSGLNGGAYSTPQMLRVRMGHACSCASRDASSLAHFSHGYSSRRILTLGYSVFFIVRSSAQNPAKAIQARWLLDQVLSNGAYSVSI
jgi:hypothetical protein